MGVTSEAEDEDVLPPLLNGNLILSLVPYEVVGDDDAEDDEESLLSLSLLLPPMSNGSCEGKSAFESVGGVFDFSLAPTLTSVVFT